jgi:hypothetical protein
MMETFSALTPEEARTINNKAIQSFLEERQIEALPKDTKTLLVVSPAGLGKTTSVSEKSAKYVYEAEKLDHLEEILKLTLDSPIPDFQPHFVFYVKTHKLAEELKDKIEGALKRLGQPISLVVLRGRTNGIDEGRAPCIYASDAMTLNEAGFSAGSSLCQERKGQRRQCPEFDSCEYISSRRLFPRFLITTHHDLRFPKLPSFELRDGEEREPGDTGFFRPGIDATTFIIDETPVEALTLREEYPLSALESIADEKLKKAISEGLQSDEGLLSHLTNHGYDSKRVRLEVKKQKKHEKSSSASVYPTQNKAEREQLLKNISKKYKWVEPFQRLAKELDVRKTGKANSLELTDVEGSKVLHVRGRFDHSHPSTPGMILDATGDAELLRQFIPNLVEAPPINVERNATITQVKSKTFSKDSLLNADKPKAEALRTHTLKYIGRVEASVISKNPDDRVLVVTYQDLRRVWTGEKDLSLEPFAPIPGHSIDVAHFGYIRGMNEFENHAAIVIVGRLEDRPAAESMAKAIWYDSNIAINERDNENPTYSEGHYFIRGIGYVKTGNKGVFCLPDDRAQICLTQMREGETLQAIDRLRLLNNGIKKEVHILCNIPLPGLTVDRLISWDQATNGGPLFERLLSWCDDNGVDALPLSPAWLNETFPGQWGTTKSAEHFWEGGTPLTSNIYYGNWGGLVEYKRVDIGGHPSKAFVRHGADPVAAISAAIGEEAIKVKRLDYPQAPKLNSSDPCSQNGCKSC